MKKLIVFLVVALSLARVDAAEAVLKKVRGIVKVEPAGTHKWVRAKSGRKLNRNDTVLLSAGAATQVSFPSGATMLIKEGSRFSIRRDKRGPYVNFRIGEFLIGLKKKLQGEERFRVRTPAAVAAVRGTVFWGKTDAEKTSQYACFTGAIAVYAQGETVALTPGTGTTITLGKAPLDATPSTISPDYIQTFAMDGSLEGLDQQIQQETSRP